MADTPDGCAASHRDPERLESWADRNLMQFNKRKRKVLHLGSDSSMNWCKVEADQLESNLTGKDLVDTKVEHEPAVGPCDKEG